MEGLGRLHSGPAYDVDSLAVSGRHGYEVEAAIREPLGSLSRARARGQARLRPRASVDSCDKPKPAPVDVCVYSLEGSESLAPTVQLLLESHRSRCPQAGLDQPRPAALFDANSSPSESPSPSTSPSPSPSPSPTALPTYPSFPPARLSVSQHLSHQLHLPPSHSASPSASVSPSSSSPSPSPSPIAPSVSSPHLHMPLFPIHPSLPAHLPLSQFPPPPSPLSFAPGLHSHAHTHLISHSHVLPTSVYGQPACQPHLASVLQAHSHPHMHPHPHTQLHTPAPATISHSCALAHLQSHPPQPHPMAQSPFQFAFQPQLSPLDAASAATEPGVLTLLKLSPGPVRPSETVVIGDRNVNGNSNGDCDGDGNGDGNRNDSIAYEDLPSDVQDQRAFSGQASLLPNAVSPMCVTVSVDMPLLYAIIPPLSLHTDEQDCLKHGKERMAGRSSWVHESTTCPLRWLDGWLAGWLAGRLASRQIGKPDSELSHTHTQLRGICHLLRINLI
ncbi:unnamed protein product [Protopolystoma xenopodis]|uniref:Uncharacterized protein n=1 Tax=Protopolystoma xenopodis TaxID=117903 RepID=A0A448XNA0_9PLAT|nr:unnamed protein product [Protopolystoma xenopodis]